MDKAIGSLRETHSIGSDTAERLVSRDACSGLAARGIGTTGLTDAGVGYTMVRPRPPMGHVLVCFGGQGEAWADGEWRTCRAGQTYLSPPLRAMAFRTVARQRWQFAWAYLPARDDEPSAVPGQAASIVACDPRQAVNAIEGLYLEASGAARVDRLDLWAELVRDYVLAVTRSAGTPDPLWRLWAEVDASPGERWSLDRLAQRAKLRPEALRRLCLRHAGRSPMRQVTHLRMRRAEALLGSTSSKLYAVARLVGYENTFAFSTTFRKWKGRPPSECRRPG